MPVHESRSPLESAAELGLSARAGLKPARTTRHCCSPACQPRRCSFHFLDELWIGPRFIAPAAGKAPHEPGRSNRCRLVTNFEPFQSAKGQADLSATLWASLRQGAEDAFARERALAPLFVNSILNRTAFEDAVIDRSRRGSAMRLFQLISSKQKSRIRGKQSGCAVA
jgi:hypothetical protein